MKGKESGYEIRRWIRLAGAEKESKGLCTHRSESGKGVAGVRGSRLQGVRRRRPECEVGSAVRAR